MYIYMCLCVCLCIWIRKWFNPRTWFNVKLGAIVNTTRKYDNCITNYKYVCIIGYPDTRIIQNSIKYSPDNYSLKYWGLEAQYKLSKQLKY